MLRVALSLGCAAGLLLSAKLWLSARDYPLSPVADWMPVASPPFDLLLFITLLALLALVATRARPSKYIAAFLLVAAMLCLTDQSRWQPWFYQYVFMLAALLLCARDGSDADRRRAVLNVCRLIVVAVYFWSGAQKLNAGFVERVFPSLVNPYLNRLFGAVDLFPRWLIMTVPLLEISIGLGLLTRKFRDASVALAVLMHALILLLLIPVGRNSVVWPWNVAMAGFAVILFWRAKDFSARDVVLPRRLGLHAVVVVLFGVMPLLSRFDLWDSYLSSTLYSGNTVAAVIHLDEATKARLPPGIQGYAQEGRAGGEFMISPDRWSHAELNVPSYPEKRIFINIARRLCAYAEDPAGVRLVIYEKPNWLSGRRETHTHNCSDL
ncbi:MAG TPA: hypothetical protein VFX96_17545 [Pyrinomonadaceae bacterium]|nr:hypothetical protein [Pyrinomonadaceae bacterium]